MKKRITFGGILKRIITGILILSAVGMMAFTVVSVTMFDRNNRSVFGYKLFIDLTDSMKPEYFQAGDIVIVKNIDDKTQIREGDVITYQSLLDDETYGKAITHKVRALTVDAQGNPGFTTYGVATGIDDGLVVTYDFVLGKYVGHIPYLGYFFQYLKTPIGYVLFILLPFLLLIAMRGLDCIKAFKKYKREQLEEINRQKAQIEEERAESKRMMAELLALKNQLAEQPESFSVPTSTPAIKEQEKPKEAQPPRENSPYIIQPQNNERI